MNKRGIFFDGLQVKNESFQAMQKELNPKTEALGFIHESAGYGKTDTASKWICKAYLRQNPELLPFEETVKELLETDGELLMLDLTKFLIFAMTQNPICRRELQKLPADVRLHYQEECKRTVNQDICFWNGLGYEELQDAQILSGIAAEAKGTKESAALTSACRFFSLLQKCWRKAKQALFTEKLIPFSRIQEWVEPYSVQPSLGMGQICILLVLAEKNGIYVEVDMNYFLLLACMKERLMLWESTETVCLEQDRNFQSEPDEEHFYQILRRYAMRPGNVIPGFLEEEWEGFDYYLKNLLHLGGIDRTILQGEELDEKTCRLIIELGGLKKEDDLEDYFYSVQIVLMSCYIRKCVNKINEINPISTEKFWKNSKNMQTTGSISLCSVLRIRNVYVNGILSWKEDWKKRNGG